MLLRNAGGEGHWLQVELTGKRSNRDAVGARLTLEAGGRRQTREVHAGTGYLSSSSLIQHFGLGTTAEIDRLHVRWPSGAETELTELRANRRLQLEEP